MILVWKRAALGSRSLQTSNVKLEMLLKGQN